MNEAQLKFYADRHPMKVITDAKGNERYKLGPSRISFENITKSRKNDKDEEQWGCVLIIPSICSDAVLREGAARVARAKWSDPAKVGLISPFKNQADLAGKYDGFSQGIYLNVSSKFKPKIIAKDGKSELGADIVYSGMWVLPVLTCYSYDVKGKRGVSFGLNSLQFLADDEHLAGGFDPSTYYDSVEDAPGAAAGATKATTANTGKASEALW